MMYSGDIWNVWPYSQIMSAGLYGDYVLYVVTGSYIVAYDTA